MNWRYICGKYVGKTIKKETLTEAMQSTFTTKLNAEGRLSKDTNLRNAGLCPMLKLNIYNFSIRNKFRPHIRVYVDRLRKWPDMEALYGSKDIIVR